VRRERPDAVLAPLEGAPAALVGRRAPLVSLLAPPGPAGSRLRTWLERRQARASLLLVAAERPVAVDCAKRWSLDLARIRVVPDLEDGLEGVLAAELRRAPARGRAWHRA
jgi:hypothetical protein